MSHTETMKWMSRSLLLLGLFFALAGMLLPVNDRVIDGQRIGQDCEGPETVLMLLVAALVSSTVGFGIGAWQSGFKKSTRDLFVIAVFLLTLLGVALKAPEVVKEWAYNQSADASCN